MAIKTSQKLKGQIYGKLVDQFGDFDAPAFATVEEGVAAMAAGKLFYALAPVGDPHEGEKRLYLRSIISTAGYVDMGDAASPVSKAYVDRNIGNRVARRASYQIDAAPAVPLRESAYDVEFGDTDDGAGNWSKTILRGLATAGTPGSGGNAEQSYVNAVGLTRDYKFIRNLTGANVSTANNDGRTGIYANRVKLVHWGQGDLFGYNVSARIMSRKPGANHWLASAAAGLINGTVVAEVDGAYINPYESLNKDSNERTTVVLEVELTAGSNILNYVPEPIYVGDYVTGPGIPAGAYVGAVGYTEGDDFYSATLKVLSGGVAVDAVATQSGWKSLTFAARISATVTEGSNVLTDIVGTFHVGDRVNGPGIRAGSYIAEKPTATSAKLKRQDVGPSYAYIDAPATASGSAVTINRITASQAICIALVTNMQRHRDAGPRSTHGGDSLGVVWGGWRPQSTGTVPVDWVVSPIGKYLSGVNFTAPNLDFGPNRAAMAIKANDRVYFNGTGLGLDTDDIYLRDGYRQTGGFSDYIQYDAATQQMQIVVAGNVVGGFSSGQLSVSRLVAPEIALTAGGKVYIGGLTIVGGRTTGWTRMTGTLDKSSAFDTESISHTQLARRVAAIEAALHISTSPNGLIGA